MSFSVNNTILVVALFALAVRFEEHGFLRILGFFGKHALFFYSCHFILWYEILGETGLFKSFDLATSVVLAVLSMFVPSLTIFLIDKYGLPRAPIGAQVHQRTHQW